MWGNLLLKTVSIHQWDVPDFLGIQRIGLAFLITYEWLSPISLEHYLSDLFNPHSQMSATFPHPEITACGKCTHFCSLGKNRVMHWTMSLLCTPSHLQLAYAFQVILIVCSCVEYTAFTKMASQKAERARLMLWSCCVLKLMFKFLNYV